MWRSDKFIAAMFKLNSTLQFVLLSQPESGMGYQKVMAVTSNPDAVIKHGIVYNAELLFIRGRTSRHAEGPITKAFWMRQKLPLEKSFGLNVETSAPPASPAFVLRETSAGEKEPSRQRSEARKDQRKGSVQTFLLPTKKDHRITARWRIAARHLCHHRIRRKRKCERGKEAVARLWPCRIPNPASNKWTIQPHKGYCNPVMESLSRPLANQAGGVEVIFTDGTQPGTVTGPEKIPDEWNMRVKLEQALDQAATPTSRSPGMGYQRVGLTTGPTGAKPQKMCSPSTPKKSNFRRNVPTQKLKTFICEPA